VPRSEHVWDQAQEPARWGNPGRGAEGQGHGLGTLADRVQPVGAGARRVQLFQASPAPALSGGCGGQDAAGSGQSGCPARSDGERLRVRQGEAALLVRTRGAAAHPEQETPERKLRLKAPSWERGGAGRDGVGPGPGAWGWRRGSFPAAGRAGGGCACEGAEGRERTGARARCCGSPRRRAPD